MLKEEKRLVRWKVTGKTSRGSRHHLVASVQHKWYADYHAAHAPISGSDKLQIAG